VPRLLTDKKLITREVVDNLVSWQQPAVVAAQWMVKCTECQATTVRAHVDDGSVPCRHHRVVSRAGRAHFASDG
jgi:hypothetical protein